MRCVVDDRMHRSYEVGGKPPQHLTSPPAPSLRLAPHESKDQSSSSVLSPPLDAAVEFLAGQAFTQARQQPSSSTAASNGSSRALRSPTGRSSSCDATAKKHSSGFLDVKSDTKYVLTRRDAGGTPYLGERMERLAAPRSPPLRVPMSKVNIEIAGHLAAGASPQQKAGTTANRQQTPGSAAVVHQRQGSAFGAARSHVSASPGSRTRVGGQLQHPWPVDLQPPALPEPSPAVHRAIGAHPGSRNHVGSPYSSRTGIRHSSLGLRVQTSLLSPARSVSSAADRAGTDNNSGTPAGHVVQDSAHLRPQMSSQLSPPLRGANVVSTAATAMRASVAIKNRLDASIDRVASASRSTSPVQPSFERNVGGDGPSITREEDNAALGQQDFRSAATATSGDRLDGHDVEMPVSASSSSSSTHTHDPEYAIAEPLAWNGRRPPQVARSPLENLLELALPDSPTSADSAPSIDPASGAAQTVQQSFFDAAPTSSLTALGLASSSTASYAAGEYQRVRQHQQLASPKNTDLSPNSYGSIFSKRLSRSCSPVTAASKAVLRAVHTIHQVGDGESVDDADAAARADEHSNAALATPAAAAVDASAPATLSILHQLNPRSPAIGASGVLHKKSHKGIEVPSIMTERREPWHLASAHLGGLPLRRMEYTEPQLSSRSSTSSHSHGTSHSQSHRRSTDAVAHVLRVANEQRHHLNDMHLPLASQPSSATSSAPPSPTVTFADAPHQDRHQQAQHNHLHCQHSQSSLVVDTAREAGMSPPSSPLHVSVASASRVPAFPLDHAAEAATSSSDGGTGANPPLLDASVSLQQTQQLCAAVLQHRRTSSDDLRTRTTPPSAAAVHPLVTPSRRPPPPPPALFAAASVAAAGPALYHLEAVITRSVNTASVLSPNHAASIVVHSPHHCGAASRSPSPLLPPELASVGGMESSAAASLPRSTSPASSAATAHSSRSTHSEQGCHPGSNSSSSRRRSSAIPDRAASPLIGGSISRDTPNSNEVEASPPLLTRASSSSSLTLAGAVTVPYLETIQSVRIDTPAAAQPASPPETSVLASASQGSSTNAPIEAPQPAVLARPSPVSSADRQRASQLPQLRTSGHEDGPAQQSQELPLHPIPGSPRFTQALLHQQSRLGVVPTAGSPSAEAKREHAAEAQAACSEVKSIICSSALAAVIVAIGFYSSVERAGSADTARHPEATLPTGAAPDGRSSGTEPAVTDAATKSEPLHVGGHPVDEPVVSIPATDAAQDSGAAGSAVGEVVAPTEFPVNDTAENVAVGAVVGEIAHLPPEYEVVAPAAVAASPSTADEQLSIPAITGDTSAATAEVEGHHKSESRSGIADTSTVQLTASTDLLPLGPGAIDRPASTEPVANAVVPPLVLSGDDEPEEHQADVAAQAARDPGLASIINVTADVEPATVDDVGTSILASDAVVTQQLDRLDYDLVRPNEIELSNSSGLYGTDSCAQISTPDSSGPHRSKPTEAAAAAAAAAQASPSAELKKLLFVSSAAFTPAIDIAPTSEITATAAVASIATLPIPAFESHTSSAAFPSFPAIHALTPAALDFPLLVPAVVAIFAMLLFCRRFLHSPVGKAAHAQPSSSAAASASSGRQMRSSALNGHPSPHPAAGTGLLPSISPTPQRGATPRSVNSTSKTRSASVTTSARGYGASTVLSAGADSLDDDVTGDGTGHFTAIQLRQKPGSSTIIATRVRRSTRLHDGHAADGHAPALPSSSSSGAAGAHPPPTPGKSGAGTGGAHAAVVQSSAHTHAHGDVLLEVPASRVVLAGQSPVLVHAKGITTGSATAATPYSTARPRTRAASRSRRR